jgi:hypothetical protein
MPESESEKAERRRRMLARRKYLAWVFGGFLFILPGLAAVLALWWAAGRPVNQGFTDATAAITFITAAAVAIERALEGFWSLVNLRTPWWPMSAVSSAVAEFQEEVNEVLAEPLDTLQGDLEGIVSGLNTATAEGQAAAAALVRYREAAVEARRRSTLIEEMAPGNERLTLMSGYVQAAADAAAGVFAASGQAVTDAGVALGKAAAYAGSATDFVAAFRENPARRVLSLSLGTTIGLVVSGLFGLNIFVAAAAAPAPDPATETAIRSASVVPVAEGTVEPQEPSLLDGVGGVLLTGLIIGLGSGPTHEVIRLIQESKRSRRQTLSIGSSMETGEVPAESRRAPLMALPTTRPEDPAMGHEGPQVLQHDASTVRMLRPTPLASTE